ncbi:endo-beta-N-acetylglucosaminidase [Vibrio ouci]|uniref:Cytosolic endo-beta-N-acetylglucosaminidase TIM barrel domain-containing protein n=1 Tax=Vibrio ouci TaxID=2499078 RepID=A0A4Y8W9I8_9VIBR|nr:hypothetical protein [Vibrio ouci]TFH89612.1 hypothetical protein ELS82_21270 [Vibrio ouci]
MYAVSNAEDRGACRMMENSNLKRTWTWYVNKPGDGKPEIPPVEDWDPSANFEAYLSKSTEPLKTDLKYQWDKPHHHAPVSQDKYLIAAMRGTEASIPANHYDRPMMRFDHWEYIRKFIFFGGSYGEGNVLAPDPLLITQAHQTGVKIYGCVFLAPGEYGGRFSDVQALVGNNNHVLKQLDSIAQYLNFEGWLINLESPVIGNEHLVGPIVESINQFIRQANREYLCYVPSHNNPFSKVKNVFTDREMLMMGGAYNSRFDDVSVWWLDRYYKNVPYLFDTLYPLWRLLEDGLYVRDKDRSCYGAYRAIKHFFDGVTQPGGHVWKGISYYTKKGPYQSKEFKHCTYSAFHSAIHVSRYAYLECQEGWRSENPLSLTDGNRSEGSAIQIHGDYLQIDLIHDTPIYEIQCWRDGRNTKIYQSVVIMTAKEKTFKNPHILFNNDHEDHFHFGPGKDELYTETEAGLHLYKQDIAGNPLVISDGRYVRIYSKGSNIDEKNMMVQVDIKCDRTFAQRFRSINAARGRQTTTGGPNATHLERVTDGIIDSHQYADLGDREKAITLDVGGIKEINRIHIWRYFADQRRYNAIVILVSEGDNFDPDHTTIVYNNDKTNYFGFGVGTDPLFAESPDGQEIDFHQRLSGSHIRLYSNGSNVNAFNHYVEVEVYVPELISQQNLASGLIPSGSTTIRNGKVATDGSLDSHSHLTLGDGLQYLEFDFGQQRTLTSIRLWHYYQDSRRYHDVVILLANQADFSDAYTVYNNDTDNSSGLGGGLDAEYNETSQGLFVDFMPEQYRYVRFYSKGSSVNQGNHYVEVRIYGT